MIARYLDRKTVTVTAPGDKIVVAAIDLPMATRLTAEHLKMVEWPVSALPPGAIKDTKDVVDRVLISHLIAGEPLRAALLVSMDACIGLAALIPQHLRAMAVRVDDVVGKTNNKQPDDRVD